jgi:ABC-type enterochelin transport system ATPase subunit
MKKKQVLEELRKLPEEMLKAFAQFLWKLNKQCLRVPDMLALQDGRVGQAGSRNTQETNEPTPLKPPK